jgi:hypothetical protein
MLKDMKLTIMGSLTKCDEFDVVEVKHNERLRGYDTFVLAHQVEQVYYLPYPCQKLNP